MPLAYLALGSNLGDRAAQLDRAVEILCRSHPVRLLQHSGWIETDPVGCPPDQPLYLNGAIEVETDLKPRALLEAMLATEESLGRKRSVPNAARTVDLDLLLYGDAILEEPGLQLPHPRLTERFFVLIPLERIAPGVVVPGTGATVAQHLARLTGIRPYGPDRQRALRGKTILVTGGSAGIGKEAVLELASAGADLIVHGRNDARVEEVMALARRRGAQAWGLTEDLAKADGPQKLWDRFLALKVPLDGWINNAGADILTGAGPGKSFDEKLEALWRVDVEATLKLSRLAGHWMKERHGGVVLNVGWDQAETGMEGDSGTLFGTTKGAIQAMSKALAVDLAPKVRVHTIAPGWIRTAWGEKAPSLWQERVLRETPLARWGEPRDVAAAMTWLMTPSAAYLSGQTIRVNGGAVRL